MKANLETIAALFAIVSLSQIRMAGADCAVSNEFRVKHPQTLTGVLTDPNDVTVPRIGLDLISRGKVVQSLRTNNAGAYDFGTLSSGRYRIHVKYGANSFCAPKVRCPNEGCRLDPRLKINPQNLVVVH
jgi:hypothetical protein